MNITGGKFNGRKITTVKSNDVRPTSSKVRGSIFSMLISLGVNFSEITFLDLFAGSGIMGLEALSRGAKKAVFVEKNPQVFKLIKQNLANFDANFETFNMDALSFMDKTAQKFDIIFLDPPYREGFYEKVLGNLPNIMQEDGYLVVEAPLEYQVPPSFSVLKHKVYGSTQVLVLQPS